jgi:ABC-2 type transport system ATP-binding protein
MSNSTEPKNLNVRNIVPLHTYKVVGRLCGVVKRFGKIEALRGIDLDIHTGEMVALLGPNGAGKTTTLSILLGLRRADKGEAYLFGKDPRLPIVRSQIGVMPQSIGFPPTLTVNEVLDLVSAHYIAPTPKVTLLQQFHLIDLARRQIGGLSGGEKRRLAVALAFVGKPSVVFLDEPTTGLDVASRRSLWQSLKEYVSQGGTILLTTHYLDEAEALATRVVVINQGRIIADGNVAAIKARVGLKRLRFKADALPALSGLVRTECEDGVYTLYTADADRNIRELISQGLNFEGLEVNPLSLEEEFLILTGVES